jgi:DNA invertase Pin-like site-specific DNA recombinase
MVLGGIALTMDRISICYGYGRHSTNKQELTQEVQEFRTREYWERSLKPKGVAWGGFLYDAATSARIPFTEREQGRKIHIVAQPGDHIVVTKLDRPFRSLRDGVVSMDQWSDRGVFFHSLDLQVDTSTPIGKFFRTVLLAVAELEREFAKERTRETVLLRQRQGLPFSRGCAIGWKIVGAAPHRKYRTDEQERELIDQMAGLRASGLSTDDIALWCVRQSGYKRVFPSRGQVRAALNARKLGYPKVTDYKKINKMAKGRA